MDINRDELRRQLRAADVAQREADRGWKEALKRIFDPESDLDTAQKAQFLGVPGRRQFLQIGGATVLGAAVLAACSSDSKTGATGSPGSSTGSSSAAGGVSDLTLGKTAASLEALAVATYDTAINSGKVTTAAIGEAAKLFKDHHQQHMDALNSVITKAGGQAVTTPNAAVKAAVIDPVVSDPALDEAKIVALAYMLEDVAAQTYVFATTALSDPGLRSTLMTISGVEARHKAILGFVAQSKAPADIIPASFFKADNPLPAAAIIN